MHSWIVYFLKIETKSTVSHQLILIHILHNKTEGCIYHKISEMCGYTINDTVSQYTLLIIYLIDLQ